MRAKEELPECPVATAVSLIGGKWKLLILRNLKERPWRFNELQRSIDGISQKVLTDSLRQMMSDGLAYRHDYHEQPPRVEYGLTELGTKMPCEEAGGSRKRLDVKKQSITLGGVHGEG